MGKRSYEVSIAKSNELAGDILCQFKQSDSIGEIGASLATVVAWWIAGAPDDEQEEIFELWAAMAKGLISVAARDLERLH